MNNMRMMRKRTTQIAISPIHLVNNHMVISQNIGSCLITNLLLMYSKTEISSQTSGIQESK